VAGGLAGQAELEHRDADEQLALDGEVCRTEDLVAVDERAVARLEVFDAGAVLLRRDPHMAPRDELVLKQRCARGRVATELQGAVQRDAPSRLGAFDDLEHVFRHLPRLPRLVLPGTRVSIGQ
jgi:hypothetical protein